MVRELNSRIYWYTDIRACHWLNNKNSAEIFELVKCSNLFKHQFQASLCSIRIPHKDDLHILKLVIRHCLISTIIHIFTNEVY